MTAGFQPSGGGSPSGTYVPVARVQGGAAGSPATETVWSYQPANTTHSMAPFQIYMWPGTFGTSPAVTETSMAWGYNPHQQVAGEIGVWLDLLPDCGDTLSAEFEMLAQFPDGQLVIPMRMFAQRDNTHSIKWTFQTGQGNGDYFRIADGFATTLLTLYPASFSGGSSLQLAVPSLYLLSPAGSNARLQLAAPTGNDFAIHLGANGAATGSAQWRITSTGASKDKLAIYDATSSVYALTFVAGAGNNGQAQFVFTPIVPVLATASAPAYVKGGVYYDSTLDALRFGGSTAWVTLATGGGPTPMGNQAAYVKITTNAAQALSAGTWTAVSSLSVTLPNDGNTYRVVLSGPGIQLSTGGNVHLGLGTDATHLLGTRFVNAGASATPYGCDTNIQQVIGSGQTISLFALSSGTPTLTLLANTGGTNDGPAELAAYRVA